MFADYRWNLSYLCNTRETINDHVDVSSSIERKIVSNSGYFEENHNIQNEWQCLSNEGISLPVELQKNLSIRNKKKYL